MNSYLSKAEITITRGENAGKTTFFSVFPILIATQSSKSILLNTDPTQEADALIKKRGDLFIIEDMGGVNKCYVNGELVLSKVLQTGDKISIQDCEILFTILRNVLFTENIHTIPTKIIDLKTHSGNEDKTYHLKFFSYTESINRFTPNLNNLKKIFDAQSDISIAIDLEQIAKTLSKHAKDFAPNLSGCALFLIDSNNNTLANIHSTSFVKDHSFTILPSLLSQIIAKRQGAKVTLKSALTKTLVLLPILYAEQLIGILYLEQTKSDHFKLSQLTMIQVLLEKCSSNIQNSLLLAEIDSLMLGTVNSMIASIEAKDTYTVGHSERVCKYAMAIADELQLNAETKKLLIISSLCHDIGKIGIPDHILKKADRLSAEEYDEMKLHPVIGANIIAYLPNSLKFISGIKYHHEKWDGTGYPEGLQGEEIPFFGRIVAVADVFDAMVSGRSYSGFIDETEAIEKIQKEAELFDPDVIKALVKAWENGKISQRTSTVSTANKNSSDKLKK